MKPRYLKKSGDALTDFLFQFHMWTQTRLDVDLEKSVELYSAYTDLLQIEKGN